MNIYRYQEPYSYPEVRVKPPIHNFDSDSLTVLLYKTQYDKLRVWTNDNGFISIMKVV